MLVLVIHHLSAVADEWALRGSLRYTLTMKRLRQPCAVGIGVVSVDADVNEDIGWAAGAPQLSDEVAWGYIHEGESTDPPVYGENGSQVHRPTKP